METFNSLKEACKSFAEQNVSGMLMMTMPADAGLLCTLLNKLLVHFRITIQIA